MIQPNWEMKNCCNHDQVVFLVTVGVCTVVILALWRTILLKPFKLVTVFLHEASHAIACKLTCGHVEGIQVHADEGGTTQTRGGIYWIILPAGYLGSSFWGMLLILASTNLLTSRIAAGCLLLALLIVLFIAKNWTLRGLCIGFMVFIGVVWILQETTTVRVLRYIILFIGVMNSLFSVYDIYDDLISRRVHSSDAEKFAEVCPCCSGAGWGTIWNFLLIAFISAIILLPQGIAGEFTLYQPYLDCVVDSSCGNFKQLKYPFALSSLPGYCRHPGFQVDCQEGNLRLTIGGNQFQVLDIDREKQLITLTTLDISYDICPKKLSNYSFKDGNFSTSENTMGAKLLSTAGCHNPPSLDREDKYVCTNSSNHTDTEVYILSAYEGYEGCQLITEVLMLKKAVADFSRKKIAATEALKQGFELSWTAVDMSWCPGCELTNGACGYNASLARFICLCIDGTQQFNCSYPLNPHEFDKSPTRGQIMKKKILIAGVTVAGVIVLLGAIFLIQYRRRILSRSSDDPLPTLDIPPTLDIQSEDYSSSGGFTLFEYSELVEATNSFYDSLGSGSYGEVFYGKLRDGREVAVKRLVGRRDRQYTYTHELRTLAKLRHPNLVNLYGYVEPSSSTSTPTSVPIYRSPILVYEYVSNGTVAEHIRGSRARSEFLQWPIRFSIVLEIARGLVYLHASRVVHCDIKTENILLDHNFRVKICDFGISQLLLPGETHKTITARGTDGYLPPECCGYRRNYHLTYKRDVYSYGVVLMELISSQPPTDEETNQTIEVRYLSDDAREKITDGRLDRFVDPNLGFETGNRWMIEGVANLGLSCLHPDSEMRPSMDEVLRRLEAIQDGTSELEQIEEICSEAGTCTAMNTLESSPHRKIQTL